MPQLRVLLGFAQACDPDLLERGQAVHDNLYTSPLWTVPPNPAIPVSATALATALGVLSTCNAAATAMGGLADTALKNLKREAVIGLLHQLASHVQDNHDNDLAKLLASGVASRAFGRVTLGLGGATPALGGACPNTDVSGGCPVI